jgi:hypothetical protein
MVQRIRRSTFGMLRLDSSERKFYYLSHMLIAGVNSFCFTHIDWISYNLQNKMKKNYSNRNNEPMSEKKKLLTPATNIRLK